MWIKTTMKELILRKGMLIVRRKDQKVWEVLSKNKDKIKLVDPFGQKKKISIPYGDLVLLLESLIER
jgi:hypothetical protein